MNTNLMIRQYENVDVFFMEDGWFNATMVAKTFGKVPKDWLKTEQVQELLFEISNGLKIPFEQNQLVKVKRGSPENGGGTWMHPKLGVHFAYWLNIKFAVWVGEQIENLVIQRTNPQSTLPTMIPHWVFGFPVVDHQTDVRFKGVRNSYISVLSALGFRAPIYKQHITDMVNELLIGHKAKPFRRMFRIPAGSRRRTRLYVDGHLRVAMERVEAIASDRILREGVTDWVGIQVVVAEVARTVRGDFQSQGINLIENVPHVRRRTITRPA